MRTFTKDFIRNNAGCYTENGKGLTIVNALDFMQEKGDNIPYTWILESSIPTKDKYWFFCKKVFSKEQNQQLAIGVASIVLEIFEKRHPNDDRPRKAIEAAQDYLDGIIDRDALLTARRNAYAAADVVAYAAAYVDDAAYDAAYAADADDAYADAADDAYAAADAAAYAAADAAGGNLQQALLLFLHIFCQENL